MTVTAQTPKGSFLPAVLLVLGGLLLMFGSGGSVFEIFPPKPDPTRWFILVDQFEDRDSDANAEYVNMLNNAEFRKEIEGITFRNWDVDQAEGKVFADSTKHTVPFYVIATPTESQGKTELKIVDSGPAPKSVDAAKALITKWIK